MHTALELADSVLAAEGVRDTAGLVSWGIGPLATVSCTLSEALCRMPIACWWVTVWSRGWPLMAKIWSASLSFPSLQKKRMDRHSGRGQTASGSLYLNLPQFLHFTYSTQTLSKK